MGARGPAGPPGKNGDDVSDLLIIFFPVYIQEDILGCCTVIFMYNLQKDT